MTQQRVALKAQGKEVGPVVLFFGARKRKEEFLYEPEFMKYQEDGFMQVHTAFSRDQEQKIYVQHRIVEESKKIFDYIHNKGGYFYVCGTSRQVPEDIFKAMKRVCQKEGSMNDNEAEAYLTNLRTEGRYIVEAWA